MAPPRKGTGKFLKRGSAIVILRSGNHITGATILEKAFRVETTDLGTLTFTIPQIQSIVYKNLPTYPMDVLRTVGGSEINGVILNDPVHIVAADTGGGIEIAKAKIISIVF